jgi:hypothetical protein
MESQASEVRIFSNENKNAENLKSWRDLTVSSALKIRVYTALLII